MTDDATTLERRRQQLATPRADPEPLASHEAVVLEAAGRRYAVPSVRVREVLPPGPLLALPGRGHDLAGARLGRQGVVVVTDVGPLRGAPAVAQPEACSVVVLEGEEPLGLLAEQVTAEQLAALPTAPPAGGGDDLVAGTTNDGLLCIDLDALLTLPRLRARARDAGPSGPTEGAS